MMVHHWWRMVHRWCVEDGGAENAKAHSVVQMLSTRTDGTALGPTRALLRIRITTVCKLATEVELISPRPGLELPAGPVGHGHGCCRKISNGAG